MNSNEYFDDYDYVGVYTIFGQGFFIPKTTGIVHDNNLIRKNSQKIDPTTRMPPNPAEEDANNIIDF